MGVKTAFGVAIAFAIISCIFFIISIASNGWISGCADFGSLVKALHENTRSNTDEGSPYSGISNGLKFCISKGVHKISMNLAGSESSLPIKGGGVQMIIGSIGIVVAILCSAAAAITLRTAVASSGDSYKGKGRATKRARVGAILLVIAGVIGLAAMIECTVETARDVYDPGRLMKQLDRANTEVVNKIAIGTSGDAESNVFGKVEAVFDYHASYSLILGWVAVVLLLISTILSFIGKKSLSSQPYTDLDANLLSEPYTVDEGLV